MTPYPVTGDPLPFECGIFESLAREDYDRTPALNQSILKKWIQIVQLEGGCPKKFKHWYEHRNDKVKSEALILGSALDCLLLEPARFGELFIAIPDDAPKRPTPKQRFAKKPSPETVASVAFWDAFETEMVGKTPITNDQHSTILAMHKAIECDEKTQDIFKYCKKATLQAMLNDMPCKGEVDLFCERTEYLFDLKTTCNASRKPFAKASWELGYHFQAAFYLKLAQALGLEKTAFCFVAVENEPPHCVAAYTLDFSCNAMQYAWKLLSQSLQPLTHHFKTNNWPDFQDFQPLAFAGWQNKEAVDFLEQNIDL